MGRSLLGGAPVHATSAQHAYLDWLVPLLALAMAFAAATFLSSLARSPSPRPGRSLGTLWALSGFTVLALFGVQEALEAALSGDAATLAPLVGIGGLIAVAASAAVGLLIALVLRGAQAAIAWVLRRRTRSLPRPSRCLRPERSISFGTFSLLCVLAPRAPPASSGR